MTVFFRKNKKWFTAAVCAILALALVFGVVALMLNDGNIILGGSTTGTTTEHVQGNTTDTAGGGQDDTTNTDDTTNKNLGTGETTDATDATDDTTASPEDETTAATEEVTEPSTEVTVPEETEPEETTQPSQPDETEPPPSTEPAPPPATTAPAPSEEESGNYDFGDATPETIRASDWNSWDGDKREAFYQAYPVENMTPEERHNFYLATEFNDYSCGVEGHACESESAHEELLYFLSIPCIICGKTNCPMNLAVDEYDLFTAPDPTKCPEYEDRKDPSKYCQTCGKPVGTWSGAGYSERCHHYNVDANCFFCGTLVQAGACHSCPTDEDIYDEYTGEYIN